MPAGSCRASAACHLPANTDWLRACAAFGPSGTSVDLPIPATPEAVFWALEKARGAYETVAEPTRREPVEV